MQREDNWCRGLSVGVYSCVLGLLDRPFGDTGKKVALTLDVSPIDYHALILFPPESPFVRAIRVFTYLDVMGTPMVTPQRHPYIFSSLFSLCFGFTLVIMFTRFSKCHWIDRKNNYCVSGLSGATLLPPMSLSHTHFSVLLYLFCLFCRQERLEGYAKRKQDNSRREKSNRHAWA